jgi:signal transduction histidine kinase/DNA-binding NarL/FixJ family response regulator
VCAQTKFSYSGVLSVLDHAFEQTFAVLTPNSKLEGVFFARHVPPSERHGWQTAMQGLLGTNVSIVDGDGQPVVASSSSFPIESTRGSFVNRGTDLASLAELVPDLKRALVTNAVTLAWSHSNARAADRRRRRRRSLSDSTLPHQAMSFLAPVFGQFITSDIAATLSCPVGSKQWVTSRTDGNGTVTRVIPPLGAMSSTWMHPLLGVIEAPLDLEDYLRHTVSTALHTDVSGWHTPGVHIALLDLTSEAIDTARRQQRSMVSRTKVLPVADQVAQLEQRVLCNNTSVLPTLFGEPMPHDPTGLALSADVVLQACQQTTCKSEDDEEEEQRPLIHVDRAAQFRTPSGSLAGRWLMSVFAASDNDAALRLCQESPQITEELSLFIATSGGNPTTGSCEAFVSVTRQCQSRLQQHEQGVLESWGTPKGTAGCMQEGMITVGNRRFHVVLVHDDEWATAVSAPVASGVIWLFYAVSTVVLCVAVAVVVYLGVSNAKHEQVLDEADQKVRAKDDLLLKVERSTVNISHDFRSPLHIVSGQVQIQLEEVQFLSQVLKDMMTRLGIDKVASPGAFYRGKSGSLDLRRRARSFLASPSRASVHSKQSDGQDDVEGEDEPLPQELLFPAIASWLFHSVSGDSGRGISVPMDITIESARYWVEFCTMLEDGLKRSLSSINDMQRMVDDFLDLAKLREGRLRLAPQPITDVLGFFQGAILQFSERASQKNVNIVLEMGEVPSVLHRIDGCRLSQILTNAMSNALKHSSDGDIVVTVEYRDTPMDDATLLKSFAQVREQDERGERGCPRATPLLRPAEDDADAPPPSCWSRCMGTEMVRPEPMDGIFDDEDDVGGRVMLDGALFRSKPDQQPPELVMDSSKSLFVTIIDCGPGIGAATEQQLIERFSTAADLAKNASPKPRSASRHTHGGDGDGDNSTAARTDRGPPAPTPAFSSALSIASSIVHAGESKQEKNPASSGLGLSNAQGFAQQMGAVIHLRNEVKEGRVLGARFEFVMPGVCCGELFKRLPRGLSFQYRQGQLPRAVDSTREVGDSVTAHEGRTRSSTVPTHELLARAGPSAHEAGGSDPLSSPSSTVGTSQTAVQHLTGQHRGSLTRDGLNDVIDEEVEEATPSDPAKESVAWSSVAAVTEDHSLFTPTHFLVQGLSTPTSAGGGSTTVPETPTGPVMRSDGEGSSATSPGVARVAPVVGHPSVEDVEIHTGGDPSPDRPQSHRIQRLRMGANDGPSRSIDLTSVMGSGRQSHEIPTPTQQNASFGGSDPSQEGGHSGDTLHESALLKKQSQSIQDFTLVMEPPPGASIRLVERLRADDLTQEEGHSSAAMSGVSDGAPSQVMSPTQATRQEDAFTVAASVNSYRPAGLMVSTSPVLAGQRAPLPKSPTVPAEAVELVAEDVVSTSRGRQVSPKASPKVRSRSRDARAERRRLREELRKVTNQGKVTLKLHVLVVDDQETQRTLMAKLLSRVGCTSVVASDQRTALRAVRQAGMTGAAGSGVPFDLVLMDMSLGAENGIDVAEALFSVCASSRPPDFPAHAQEVVGRSTVTRMSWPRVVACTGDSHEDLKQRLRDHGFQGILVKGFTLDHFTRTLQRVAQENMSSWDVPLA